MVVGGNGGGGGGCGGISAAAMLALSFSHGDVMVVATKALQQTKSRTEGIGGRNSVAALPP